jgi:hypothetical protein
LAAVIEADIRPIGGEAPASNQMIGTSKISGARHFFKACAAIQTAVESVPYLVHLTVDLPPATFPPEDRDEIAARGRVVNHLAILDGFPSQDGPARQDRQVAASEDFLIRYFIASRRVALVGLWKPEFADVGFADDFAGQATRLKYYDLVGQGIEDPDAVVFKPGLPVTRHSLLDIADFLCAQSSAQTGARREKH